VKIDAEKLAKVERIDLVRSVVATGKIQPVTQVEIKSKAAASSKNCRSTLATWFGRAGALRTGSE